MRLLAIAAAALLSACASSIESRTADGGGVGLSYMAPMRLLTVNATRAAPASGAVVTTARNSLVAAENELTAANTALRAATADARDARALATAGPDIADLQSDADTKEAVQRAAQTRVNNATAAVTLARSTYQNAVTAAAPSVNLTETVEITMGPAIGDPNTRFVANVNTNWFRSARGRIVVGQNGLLQSANLTVDGQLDEVLVGVAQSIVAIQSSGGLSAHGIDGREDRTLVPRCSVTGELQNAITATPGPTTLSLTFDPVRPGDVNMVNYALCSAGFSYRLATRPLGQAQVLNRTVYVAPSSVEASIERARQEGLAAGRAESAAAASETNRLQSQAEALLANLNVVCRAPNGQAAGRCPGLAYRQNEPMHVDIIRYDNANKSMAYVERSFSFSVPNNAPIDVLRYDDATFVTRRDDVGFVDGSLVSLDFDRPSEAAVAASIPFRIVRGTTEALSELVQLRVNLANQEAALATAEQTAANNQASGAANAEIQQLQNAQRLLELRLQVEQARQRLLEAEAEAAAGGD